MPINRLTAYCHDAKTKDGKCGTCAFNCDNICKHCLELIHFENPHGRSYDCENMIFCYSCSYIYKYASEIQYIFEKHTLQSFNEFNILSLGCGSCADLLGIDNFLTSTNRTLPINYTGVDLNPLWRDTHNEIINILPNYNISFINNDVYDYLDSLNNGMDNPPNILILQYILNELVKNDIARIPEFIEKLINNIINRMPENSLIIINDINHYSIRTHFSSIFREAQENNIVSYLNYRFREPTTHTYGGTMHDSSNLKFDIPVVINTNYDVKSVCSSSQAVIFKTRNKNDDE